VPFHKNTMNTSLNLRRMVDQTNKVYWMQILVFVMIIIVFLITILRR